MVTIKTFTVGYLQTNCYVVSIDSSDKAVIIDAGGGYNRIKDYLTSINKKAVAVLFTHGHFDHIFDAKKWQDSGAKLYIHALDAEMLEGKGNLAADMGLMLPTIKADKIVNDNEIIEFDGLSFEVMHTPGHTKGGVCYILNDEYLFSGDTIFFHSYGRTDFYGGDYEQLFLSVKKVLALNKDYVIYPGHGGSTTVNEEKLFNPMA